MQVPTSWRGLIEDPKTTDLLFKLYMSTANNGPVAQSAATPRSAQALESLIQLASVRRSLYEVFLSPCVTGLTLAPASARTITATSSWRGSSQASARF